MCWVRALTQMALALSLAYHTSCDIYVISAGQRVLWPTPRISSLGGYVQLLAVILCATGTCCTSSNKRSTTSAFPKQALLTPARAAVVAHLLVDAVHHMYLPPIFAQYGKHPLNLMTEDGPLVRRWAPAGECMGAECKCEPWYCHSSLTHETANGLRALARACDAGIPYALL